VAKSIADWIKEGEALYEAALKEFEELDAKARQLEKQLAQKQEEVNQIAQVIGKPLAEGNRRLTAQLVDDHGPLSVPTSSTTIARALSGRNINR
jgi:exonuclease VII small subunit